MKNSIYFDFGLAIVSFNGTNGCCTCIVVSTNMSTEIGKIQAQIQEASMEAHDTLLKRKLDEFCEILTSALFVFLYGS